MAEAPRLKQRYTETVRPALQEHFGYKNVHLIPKLEKIVVNMGVGEATTDSKAIDAAVSDLRTITGQQPMTVLYMFQHSDQFQVGERHSKDN